MIDCGGIDGIYGGWVGWPWPVRVVEDGARGTIESESADLIPCCCPRVDRRPRRFQSAGETHRGAEILQTLEIPGPTEPGMTAVRKRFHSLG